MTPIGARQALDTALSLEAVETAVIDALGPMVERLSTQDSETIRRVITEEMAHFTSTLACQGECRHKRTHDPVTWAQFVPGVGVRVHVCEKPDLS